MMFTVSVVGAKLSYNFKIGAMYLFASGLVLILPFWAYTMEDEETRFSLTIVNLMLFGICVAFLQASGFAFSGSLPGKYIGIFMVGQGVSGIGMNIIRLISIVIFPPQVYDPKLTPEQNDP
jgi:hypothetical protein